MLLIGCSAEPLRGRLVSAAYLWFDMVAHQALYSGWAVLRFDWGCLRGGISAPLNTFRARFRTS